MLRRASALPDAVHRGEESQAPAASGRRRRILDPVPGSSSALPLPLSAACRSLISGGRSERMADALVQMTPRRFGQTMRPDAWWVQPLVVFTILGAFVVYATWAAFQGRYYTYGPYLSPFYAPELFGDSPHAWFGPKPGWWPGWLPFSPALIILPFPGLFRFTCYYYRGAYYKAFWADPPNCAVGEPRNAYLGERSLPLVLQNVHRYFLYVALA